jgi:hypothetical protein
VVWADVEGHAAKLLDEGGLPRNELGRVGTTPADPESVRTFVAPRSEGAVMFNTTSCWFFVGVVIAATWIGIIATL